MLVDETSTASQNSQFADKRIPQEKNNVNKNSLSNTNEDIAPVRSDNVYGDDIKLQTASAEDIAPIGENVVKKKQKVKTQLSMAMNPFRKFNLWRKPNPQHMRIW